MNVPVRFGFQEFCSELNSLKAIARKFLGHDAGPIIDQAVQQLEQIQSLGSAVEYRFEVHEDRPIRSVTSGNFEGKGRRSSFDIYGTASWVWGITPVSNNRGVPSEFEVTGIASTKIRIFKVIEDVTTEIAMWRIELGDLASPGTYFHTQVLGETEDIPFPHSLPVPRLPSLFVTPMSAVEFMLSEIFQHKWGEHAIGDGDALKFWNHIQSNRLKNILSWKLEQLKDIQSSPWVALKEAKPKSDESLFVKGGR